MDVTIKKQITELTNAWKEEEEKRKTLLGICFGLKDVCEQVLSRIELDSKAKSFVLQEFGKFLQSGTVIIENFRIAKIANEVSFTGLQDEDKAELDIKKDTYDEVLQLKKDTIQVDLGDGKVGNFKVEPLTRADDLVLAGADPEVVKKLFKDNDLDGVTELENAYYK